MAMFTLEPSLVRSASRNDLLPELRLRTHGFRVARTIALD